MQTDASCLTGVLADERLDTVNERICLIQKKKGLTFGTDAFLLAAFIRPSPRAVCVELGAGSGIISFLLAAKKKVSQITAVEIQTEFANIIERNIALNNMGTTVLPLCADIRTLSPSQLGKEADLVFSNPPYMKCNNGKRNEEMQKYIARHEVCGNISDFCNAAGRLLRYGGKFVCVWRPDRLADLFSALRDARLEPKRITFVHADESLPPCMVLVESVKGGAPSVKITPPLFLYTRCNSTKSNSTRELTPKAKMIYEECKFPD